MKKKPYLNKKTSAFIVLCILSLFISCSSKNKISVYRKSKPLMDTFVTITVVSDSEAKAGKAIEDAFSEIERFGDLINFFSDSSEVSLINRNAGTRAVKVSQDTLNVIQKAVSVSEQSGGAFDVTIGPVMSLWDFHKKVKPDEIKIKKKLSLVNYKKMIIDSDSATVFLKDKGMLLDLGGIAKGYAADLAVKNLRQSGIQAGIVAVAGDIKTFGLKPDGKAWKVGIKNPRQKNESDEIIATINLDGSAISTSGDYERFFMVDGKRYHHLLDPKTGHPVDTFQGVSIITNESVFADAFSTAVFILGKEKGLKMLKEKGMEAVIIENNGEITATPGLKGRLKIGKNN